MRNGGWIGTSTPMKFESGVTRGLAIPLESVFPRAFKTPSVKLGVGNVYDLILAEVHGSVLADLDAVESECSCVRVGSDR